MEIYQVQNFNEVCQVLCNQKPNKLCTLTLYRNNYSYMSMHRICILQTWIEYFLYKQQLKNFLDNQFIEVCVFFENNYLCVESLDTNKLYPKKGKVYKIKLNGFNMVYTKLLSLSGKKLMVYIEKNIVFKIGF